VMVWAAAPALKLAGEIDVIEGAETTGLLLVELDELPLEHPVRAANTRTRGRKKNRAAKRRTRHS